MMAAQRIEQIARWAITFLAWADGLENATDEDIEFAVDWAVMYCTPVRLIGEFPEVAR